MSTEQDYSRTDGAITATAIKAGAISMAHMRAAMTGGAWADTPSTRRGRLTHAACLQPQRFWEGIAVWSGDARRGKEWEGFKAANASREIITEDERGELDRLIDAVWSHERAAELLRGCETEQVREWTNPQYGAAKCRLDGIAPAYWLELKTTAAASIPAYAAQHYRLGYHFQLGWYSIAANADRPRVCYLITVCTGDVPDVVLYHVPGAVVDAGREAAVDIAAKYRACEEMERYTGVDGGEFEVEFVPPAWAGGKVDLVIGGETVEV